ncbi:MAG TPA: 2OG-Fe(II) oxygenase [Alphaproteobacteria bacterium]|nr:2OG-Fe(II) oxygenase [Alphaproteobacteria bacterium]
MSDWTQIAGDLDRDGCAVIPGLLDTEKCWAMVALWSRDALFRKRIDMARHGYGQGVYKYFAYPLPDPIADLRARLYPPLAEIGNRWNAALGIGTRYPTHHAGWLDICHAAGQTRPTPLILRYGPGDYNRLHQDLYGEHVFPLQVAILLSRPVEDFSGGELVLTEQRARMQSRPEVVPLTQGDAVVFPVNHRPVPSPRGVSRAAMRHGVSRLRSGERLTLGIIFHDAA